MSGPKTSRYTLTPEQRRILEEQRQLEQRRAVARQQVCAAHKKMLQIGEGLQADGNIAQELLARTGSDNGVSDLIAELNQVLTPMYQLAAETNYEDVDSVEGTAVKMQEALIEAQQLEKQIITASAENEGRLRETLNAALDQGFSTSFADLAQVPDGPSCSQKKETIAKLQQLKNLEDLPEIYEVEIEEAISKAESITDEVFLKNWIAISADPLIRRVNSYLVERNACRDEFEKLYAEYVALCDLYYYVPQGYFCSRESVNALSLEIQRIKDTVAENDEQAYICDCLDEVMEEMGYTVIGSRQVTKKNGKHFRNELYTYGEGTAVNVTYSSDGKIAMELGGLDVTDRLPDERETDRLCQSMEQFCGDFREIEKRLLAKGVVLASRISILPVSPEYAQIINTSDYEMREAAETFQVKKQRRAAQKRKTLRKA